MIADLPIAVQIEGKTYPIREKCDYRVVLDCIRALKDDRFSDWGKIECALRIFFQKIPKNKKQAVEKMFEIISCGMESNEQEKEPVMDWEHDFQIIAPPIGKILGYDVRTPGKYTHWWTFVGAYMELPGECLFGTVIEIRKKRQSGKKMEDWERKFLLENFKIVNLPKKMSKEDSAFLRGE